MAVNAQRIEFRSFQEMARHLDRWASESLATPEGWNEALLDVGSWLDYSARNQVLLASYGADGPVAGPETWRLVASTTEGRGCAPRAGEHGYPVRVPVTTGGHEPDPYLGGHRPTRAQVERWEWRPVFSVAQLARKPAPDSLIPVALPDALTGPDAETAFAAAARQVAATTVRGRLAKQPDPHQLLADAAGRLRRSTKRPELDPVLRTQVAWLVADRVGLAPTEAPVSFDPGPLTPRERWERLNDVLEPARQLTAALGVTVGVDLVASPLPRMEIVDDRVVTAGRRHRLPAASLEQLPIGQWVTVGPYTPAEWAARGENASGQGSYLRLNRSAYLVAVETGDGAGWRLEDVAARTGHGLLATGTATTLDHARTDAATALRDRYPALTQPREPNEAGRGPGGTARGWEPMPGHGRRAAELRHLDDEITLYVMPGPGGRWQPTIHTAASRSLERLELAPTVDDARTRAEVAGRRAQRAAEITDPVRGDPALAAFADSGNYDRSELAALIEHRLEPADARRVASATPGELVELLGAAGFSPATTVAVLHAETIDAPTVAALLPTIGVPMADAIRVLHERWDCDRITAAELLDATGAEMRDAGATPSEIMAARPRDVLRTLGDDPHLWELAAGTMLAAGHPASRVTGHLVAHAPSPDAFAAGLTTVVDASDGLALAARHHAHPDQLAAASEAYGLSPAETATVLAGTTSPDVVLDTLTLRCDGNPDMAVVVAADAGITDVAVAAWRDPTPTRAVAPIRAGITLDTDALLAALPPPGPSSEHDPVQLLDQLTLDRTPIPLEHTP